MQDNNYNDLIQVLSGHKDVKISFDSKSAMILFISMFLAVLLANMIGSRL